MKTFVLPGFLTAFFVLIFAPQRGESAPAAGGDGFYKTYSENQAVIDLQGERIVGNQSLIVKMMGEIAESRKKITVSLLRDNEDLTRIRDGAGDGGGLFQPVASPAVTVDIAGMLPDMEVDPDADWDGDSSEQQREEAAAEAEDLTDDAETETVDEAQDDDAVLEEVVEELGPEDFMEEAEDEIADRGEEPEDPGEFVPEEEWEEYLAAVDEWESMGEPEDALDMEDIDWDEVSGEVDSMDLDELINDSSEAEDLYEEELADVQDDIEIEIDIDID